MYSATIVEKCFNESQSNYKEGNKNSMQLLRARETGEGIKHVVQALGSHQKKALSSRSGRQRCRPFYGLNSLFLTAILGFAPRLYAFARSAGSKFTMRRCADVNLRSCRLRRA